jgi:hypothetical protein
MNISPFFYDFVHDCEDLIKGVSAEEGDASLAEVGQSFEDG